MKNYAIILAATLLK